MERFCVWNDGNDREIIWWYSTLDSCVWQKLRYSMEGENGSISAVIPHGRGPWGYRMLSDRTEQVSSISSSWRKWRILSYIWVPPYSSIEVSLLLCLYLISLCVLTLSIPPSLYLSHFTLYFSLSLFLSLSRYTRTFTQVTHVHSLPHKPHYHPSFEEYISFLVIINAAKKSTKTCSASGHSIFSLFQSLLGFSSIRRIVQFYIRLKNPTASCFSRFDCILPIESYLE